MGLLVIQYGSPGFKVVVFFSGIFCPCFVLFGARCFRSDYGSYWVMWSWCGELEFCVSCVSVEVFDRDIRWYGGGRGVFLLKFL